jgi:hypothetical protein
MVREWESDILPVGGVIPRCQRMAWHKLECSIFGEQDDMQANSIYRIVREDLLCYNGASEDRV